MVGNTPPTTLSNVKELHLVNTTRLPQKGPGCAKNVLEAGTKKRSVQSERRKYGSDLQFFALGPEPEPGLGSGRALLPGLASLWWFVFNDVE